ncbi:MAG: hypothetical protein PHR82_05090 [Endomicrobiaceae bacterium]|nr:hypothetical protein [Endomicrobiaceae bacterium]
MNTYGKFLRNNLQPDKKLLNYDLLILKTAEKLLQKKHISFKNIIINFDKPKILILNSAIYDGGGHTEVSIRFIKAFKDDYSIDFYSTTFDDLSQNTAPVKSKIIKNSVRNYTELSKNTAIDYKITKLYNYIIENRITTVCVNMNPADVVCCAVLGLLKKYTDINIIFWNNVSHCYSLGTEFANTILTRCKYGKPITPYLKNKINAKHIPFLGSDNNINIYSTEQISALKQKLTIPQNAFVTMTGVHLYKVNKKYFKFLNKLLQKHDNIYHVFISTSSAKTKEAVKKLFEKNKNRFVMIDSVLDFDLFIQMSDLYIDSFPQGSALTLVDFIKHAKPVLIKINEVNPLKSFETYLYRNYEYACKTTDEMLEKISVLINDKQEYVKISQKVKKYYTEYYNTDIIKKQHRKLLR